VADYDPEKHGFHLNVPGIDKPQPPSDDFSTWNLATLSNGKPGDYLTDRLGEEVLRIDGANGSERDGVRRVLLNRVWRCFFCHSIAAEHAFEVRSDLGAWLMRSNVVQ
jgi:hypothetical protein